MDHLRLLLVIAWLTATSMAMGSEYHGQVTFGGLPLPGATVTATQGAKKITSVTDQRGFFSFPGLTSGAWTMEVQMTGFSTIQQEVVVSSNTPPAHWELKLLPLAQIKAKKARPTTSAREVAGGGIAGGPKTTPSGPGSQNPSDPGASTQGSEGNLSQLALPGLLINGSENNGASSP